MNKSNNTYEGMMYMNNLYGAYGSNISIKAMETRCPQAKVVGVTDLDDYALFFAGDKEGFLSIRPSKGTKVPLVIWEITPDCEAALDDYEAYPRLYGKEQVTVTLNDTPKEVMVYVMAAPYSDQAMAPSDKYVKVLREGYADFDLDFNRIEQALAEITD